MLAFRYLPLADAHALASTSPLIVIVLGVVFLGEHADLPRWLAVLAGFMGMLLIVRPGFRELDGRSCCRCWARSCGPSTS